MSATIDPDQAAQNELSGSIYASTIHNLLQDGANFNPFPNDKFYLDSSKLKELAEDNLKIP